ncbi:penicillin-insensitive murein endopeptidase [Benzoatithermus flavus]|uniref:Penicillin-insensitive murein endopeptidase n=1 Tax=Benzoatithermus flavus TaxID=3108223 RepID=A0ABU8XU34_9PROT
MWLLRTFWCGVLAGLAVSLAAAVSVPAASGETLSANQLFGAVREPTADRRPEVIGSYARGCLRGAVELPVSGPGWEVMRLSRNRNWSHPSLVRFIERLAADTEREDGVGILVGDLGQPRGGPARFGHASHQIGLDADIWLMPPPARPLSLDDRERLVPVSMVQDDRYAVDPSRFGRRQAALIRRAALSPEVARIFVNPGIKAALCATAEGDRRWLGKVRPWWGHDAHMHVRLRCPAGQLSCEDQDPPPAGDGCGAELERWLGRPPYKPKDTTQPARPVALAALPAECRVVLREP